MGESFVKVDPNQGPRFLGVPVAVEAAIFGVARSLDHISPEAKMRHGAQSG